MPLEDLDTDLAFRVSTEPTDAFDKPCCERVDRIDAILSLPAEVEGPWFVATFAVPSRAPRRSSMPIRQARLPTASRR